MAQGQNELRETWLDNEGLRFPDPVRAGESLPTSGERKGAALDTGQLYKWKWR
jgi:hypothetical protein